MVGTLGDLFDDILDLPAKVVRKVLQFPGDITKDDDDTVNKSDKRGSKENENKD